MTAPTSDEEPDVYAILGVPSRADDETIRRAYKKLASRWHPDRYPDTAGKSIADERFREIASAWEKLKTPEKRAAYDKTRPPVPVLSIKLINFGSMRQGEQGETYHVQLRNAGGEVHSVEVDPGTA